MLALLLAALTLSERQLARALPALAVDELGLLTRVPAFGLESVDGPSVRLEPGFAEWFGVAFTEQGVRRAGVAAGNAPDWAGRASVVPVSFRSGEGWAQARTRSGPLEIRTEFELREPYLLAAATLENRGATTLSGIVYSREWRTGSALGWSFPPDLEERPAPADVGCRLWMLDDLEPGASSGLLFSYRLGPQPATLGNVEVPLALFQNADWPNGLQLGATNGVSFGDYDADGWIDIFACMSARLLRNVGGVTWRLAADLDSVLPFTSNRYGSSFGDYDNDGLQDIGTEPRATFNDSCMHLLHNLGDAQFVDVAIDPTLVIGQPCNAPSETICWGDVEEDGDLDLFLPVYPSSAGGPGNFFLENLGPSGPGGAYRLIERSGPAGLNNPPMTARPEGAQFADLDDDGDLDLYSNGTLYQNRSGDSVDFDAMEEAGSGIGARQALDEGAAFFDYDLDGDQDLFIVYTNRGVRSWEGRGDGTFKTGVAVIDEPNIGLDLGLSAEDWDNDGDVDFTTRQVFRRNRFVEDGLRHFTVATHAIPSTHLTSATPAWGDWDKDGDLDCALGNWQSVGHFYENVLYGPDVPAAEKPYVRVRVVRDDPLVARGLEVEYGANVELVLHGDPLRREKFVASGHGYLNQNEYVLHFALPPGPVPGEPLAGQVFDLVVDFPSRPSRGVLRIDRHVNPALGDIVLAELDEREITVYRSGRVRLDGVDRPQLADGRSPRLFATGGGLALPDPALGLAAPTLAGSSARWVGIELATDPTVPAALVKELVLDGQLAPPLPRADFNLALWDVSDPLHPERVLARTGTTAPRNRRSHFPFVVELRPGRRYRCVALVSELRASPLAGARSAHGLALKGGLDFVDAEPATAKELVQARPDPNRVFLALRYVAGARTARAR